ncbi:MAG: RNA methyltransferase [Bacteroidetes bacterium]|nr:RNA methyltransferase [Bacteroidota bacterium]
MSNANFPPDFLSRISGSPGFDRESFVEAHEKAEAPTSIRLNPFKPGTIIHGRQVLWCEWGYYLGNRPSFTFDPLFHAGCYYVQEASSMFIGRIIKHIKPDNNIKVLDLCAAPGGKSTLISSLLNSGDLLVANEIIKTRVPVLSDNLTRWGPSNTIVTNNDPKDFARLKGLFDIIVVDAPCSGSGMFRKDPDAMSEWSEANVNLCHQRQERILADVYPTLKEDGYLIYSTCSYSVEENEQILDWLCDEFELESIRVPIEPAWGIVESQSDKRKAWGYRFYPGKVEGEGLFAACLVKQESSIETSFRFKEQQKPNYKEIDLLKPYIKNADQYHYFKVGDDWLAIDKVHKESLHALQQYLYIKKSGVRLGKLTGKELIPDHELALSLIVNKDAFLQTELNKEQAIQYLRRDNISNLELNDKGWSLMSYKEQALGWAKLLPNRINNYYPKEIRIMSQQ